MRVYLRIRIINDNRTKTTYVLGLALAFLDLSSKLSKKLSSRLSFESDRLSEDGIVGLNDEGIAVAVGSSCLFPM